jgi:hypothetical protein
MTLVVVVVVVVGVVIELTNDDDVGRSSFDDVDEGVVGTKGDETRSGVV